MYFGEVPGPPESSHGWGLLEAVTQHWDAYYPRDSRQFGCEFDRLGRAALPIPGFKDRRLQQITSW